MQKQFLQEQQADLRDQLGEGFQLYQQTQNMEEELENERPDDSPTNHQPRSIVKIVVVVLGGVAALALKAAFNAKGGRGNRRSR